jgi:hypothetical protein
LYIIPVVTVSSIRSIYECKTRHMDKFLSGHASVNTIVSGFFRVTKGLESAYVPCLLGPRLLYSLSKISTLLFAF